VERLVFDIETAPLPDAADYLEAIEVPANYKDPEKIATYVAECHAEQLKRCSLDVGLCRIVAIGMWRDRESAPEILTAADMDEPAMLARFWTNADRRQLVGFNCITFDLPVLLRRSLYLGVRAPSIQVDRFRHPTVTDLLQVLSHHGALRLRSLNFYCRRFGFAVTDTLTGADIAAAVANGRWSEIETHVRADVQKTALLAAKVRPEGAD
jgi:predicted PolB exonuclease-like 3'-5' exonuclease